MWLKFSPYYELASLLLSPKNQNQNVRKFQAVHLVVSWIHQNEEGQWDSHIIQPKKWEFVPQKYELDFLRSNALRSIYSRPLWECVPSAWETLPSLYYHPIYDLCRVFSHSSTRTHGFLLFVWLLSVCHQQAHNFPTAECVILVPAVLSPSRKHTVFLNGFPDELGHFSQEAGVGPNSSLFTRASVCSMRRATSDDFLPVTLRVRPIIPEHYLTVWAL